MKASSKQLHTYATPCMILRLEFDENSAEHPEQVKMTAVRVNGDMKQRVNIDIDAESSNFDCKDFGIKYHSGGS